VVFTSGATESINLAVQGFLAARTKIGRARIVVSPVEHRAVLETCRVMARRGAAELVELHVDNRGRLDLDEIERVCAGGADLLCVMAANNEVGNVYPVSEIGAIAQRHGTEFLCDATQAAGKVPLSAEESGASYLALSAHKMYGPKGVGALVIRNSPRLRPLIFGGEQEGGLRPGTLNVPGIAGLGEACRLRRLEMEQDEPTIRRGRDHMQAVLAATVPDLVVNGDPENRLAGNLHVSIPGVPNQAIIARVRHRVAIATGSACSSGIEAPSHVLRAMHLPDPVVEGALRIGIGKFTSDAEINSATHLLISAVRDVRECLRDSAA
jgi:cysteine desulfurase